MQERNVAYYSKFPEDIQRMASIMRYLMGNKILLPSGAVLTPSVFRQLGLALGMHGKTISLLRELVLYLTAE